MGQILQFRKPTGMRRFFETEEGYRAYLKAEEECRKEPLGPFLTLEELWYILTYKENEDG